MKRTLSLTREALTALTTEEMTFVGAGDTGPQPTPPVWAPRTLAVKECLATSQDSLAACSNSCLSGCASCAC